MPINGDKTLTHTFEPHSSHDMSFLLTENMENEQSLYGKDVTLRKIIDERYLLNCIEWFPKIQKKYPDTSLPGYSTSDRERLLKS
jgi:hypothetical protein